MSSLFETSTAMSITETNTGNDDLEPGRGKTRIPITGGQGDSVKTAALVSLVPCDPDYEKIAV